MPPILEVILQRATSPVPPPSPELQPTTPRLQLRIDSLTHEGNALMAAIPLPTVGTNNPNLANIMINLGFREESIRLSGIVNEQVARNGDANAGSTGVRLGPGAGTGTNPWRIDLWNVHRKQYESMIDAPLNVNSFPALSFVPSGTDPLTDTFYERWRGIIASLSFSMLGGEPGKWRFSMVFMLRTNETQMGL